jgi:putative glutamine amidotransferase
MNGSAMSEIRNKPRVGVPWRTAQDEKQANWAKLENYLDAVKAAGGEPVAVSLEMSPSEISRLAKTLDAIVLPGSPADVEPSRYGAARHPNSAEADPSRERTDWALLDNAFAEKKPVLAICYGVQLLNVYLGGSLIQDIHSLVNTTVRHRKKDPPETADDPFHPARLAQGSCVEHLAGSAEAQVNSSHHQSIERPGQGLRVTALAPDGIIEAVEGTGDSHWVVGVQWHPERMFRNRAARQLDQFSVKLFAGLVAAAPKVPAAAR